MAFSVREEGRQSISASSPSDLLAILELIMFHYHRCVGNGIMLPCPPSLSPLSFDPPPARTVVHYCRSSTTRRLRVPPPAAP